MKTLKRIIIAAVIIILVVIIAFVSIYIYDDQFKKREIYRESSPNNEFVLILYQVGSPGWSFGPVKASLVLKNAANKVIDKASFSLQNDGAPVLEENIVEITWLENQVKIIMDEADTSKEYTYLLNCSGLNKDLTDEKLAEIVAANLGVPKKDTIEYSVSEEKYFWEAAGRYYKNVTFSENGETVATAAVDPTNGELLRNIFKYEIKKSLTDKLISEIDVAYKEELNSPEDSSTVGMIEISDKYTEKWKNVAEEYYNKLIKYNGIVKMDETQYSSEDFHKFISNMKTSWERYYNEQCENYEKALYAIYAGSVGGPVFADYKYNMQKEWALELVNIYEKLESE